MEYLDTQILVAAAATGDTARIRGRRVSSLVANEFLDAHTPDPAQARYYVPVWNLYGEGINTRRTPRQCYRGFHRNTTDCLIVDFNNCFPSIREYNNIAVALAINEHRTNLFASAISELPKDRRRRLYRRFHMLLATGIVCRPISGADIETALSLLDAFTRAHTLKSRFRNSWNDLVILAASANAHGRLLTEDSLLSRFAASALGGKASPVPDGLALTFPSESEAQRTALRESKGYINRGWRICTQRRR